MILILGGGAFTRQLWVKYTGSQRIRSRKEMNNFWKDNYHIFRPLKVDWNQNCKHSSRKINYFILSQSTEPHRGMCVISLFVLGSNQGRTAVVSWLQGWADLVCKGTGVEWGSVATARLWPGSQEPSYNTHHLWTQKMLPPQRGD